MYSAVTLAFSCATVAAHPLERMVGLRTGCTGRDASACLDAVCNVVYGHGDGGVQDFGRSPVLLRDHRLPLARVARLSCGSRLPQINAACAIATFGHVIVLSS